MDIVQTIGFVASVVLPFWNIPLIIRIIQRKSSQDLSMSWLLGVWVCIILMTPAGFRSSDIMWRVFTFFNLVCFTAVVIVSLKYRKGNPHG